MDIELFRSLKDGDKIKFENENILYNLTGSSWMRKYGGKTVTVIRCGFDDYINIEEDDNLTYFCASQFKNIINGVNHEKPIERTRKYKFDIMFSVREMPDHYYLKNYKLVKITDQIKTLTRYNTLKLSRIIKGKWVIINNSNNRIYTALNPHLLLKENGCDNYRLDGAINLIVDIRDITDESKRFAKMGIDFRNGTCEFLEYDGDVCLICGEPLTPTNSIGKYCNDCLRGDRSLTYRFGYHDYDEGYPTPERVNTRKVPVFGCEIERDYHYDCERERDWDDDEDDDYYSYDDEDYENEVFYDNLDSATMAILKAMQQDQIDNGTLKRQNVFMSDGSLNFDGLEWITFPQTFDWYVENKDKFDKAIEKIQDYGFCNTDYSGNHIHINRDFFTVDGRDYSDFCASKMAVLISKYWEEFRAIANRRTTDYTKKPKVEHYDSPFDIAMKTHEARHDHGIAVNLQHDATIEIRLWGGIDNASDLLFYLDNMQALARWVKKTSLEKVQSAKITDFMKLYRLDSSVEMAYNRMKNWMFSTLDSNVVNQVKKLLDAKKGENK